MKRLLVVITIGFLLSACSKEAGVKRKLNVVEGKKFHRLEFRKVFEITLHYCKWCFPVYKGVLCLQSLDSQNRKFRLTLFDYDGKVIKKRDFLTGQGPNELLASIFRCAWVRSDLREVIAIDVGEFVKSINAESLTIRTIAKPGLKNFYFCKAAALNNVEEKGDRAIMAMGSAGFYENNTYYIVEWDRMFKNYRVIRKLKKMNPQRLKTKKKRVIYTDYYWKLREALPLTVDWKREVVYLVPDTAEKPLIERMDVKTGKSERYRIEIDFKKFKIDRKRIEYFCQWFNEELPELLKKSLKYLCYFPSYPPPVQGIKVIKDWLLVITGKRKWNEGRNWTLVYRLPELSYEGSFYIPFPDYGLEIKWIDGNYYITRKVLEGENVKYSIYRVKEK